MWLEERANTSTSQSAYLCVVGNVGETWLYGDNGVRIFCMVTDCFVLVVELLRCDSKQRMKNGKIAQKER